MKKINLITTLLKSSLLLLVLVLLSVSSMSSLAIVNKGGAFIHQSGVMTNTDTVFVAPPTGEQVTDRESIVATIEQVQPGDVIQFAPGTYHVGSVVRTGVPRLTLLGHPDGTVLRGCDPAAFVDLVENIESSIARLESGGQVELPDMNVCGILHLFEGGQTVRDLTFENSWWGLMLGWHYDDNRPVIQGGNRIEGNTFRYSANGIRTTSSSPTVSEIRSNSFINVRYAASVLGSGIHLLDNDFTVPEPERLFPGRGDVAIRFAAERHTDLTSCQDNVIAGNRITGYAGGIALYSDPGTSCRNNVIRRNTIALRRVVADASDPGLPISLDARPSEEDTTPDGVVAGTLVERNHLVRADGPGIVISRGSVGNRILDNIFEDIAADAIVLEGDSNRVELRDKNDDVRDLGNGNSITSADRYQSQKVIAADTTEVLAAAETFLTAFNNLDWETFHSSFDSSVTVFQPFRDPWRNNGLDEVASFFQTFFELIRSNEEGPPYLNIVPEDLRIQLMDNVAVVTFHLNGDESVGRRTLVFGRNHEEGPWKIVHLHASLQEQPRRENETDLETPDEPSVEGEARGHKDIEDEARQFMAGYAADLLSHDPDAIAARYSRRGAYMVFPGERKLKPYDAIVQTYRDEWRGPKAFEWQDLSYEALGDDVVAVIGAFIWEYENGGSLGTYSAILVREDGELRIRLENEFFDNLPPVECATQEEPCDLPLEAAARERYTGKYEISGREGSARVYEEDGNLRIHSPGFPPMRLLYRGGDEFRVADHPAIRILFDGVGERAATYIVLQGMVLETGTRVTTSHGLDDSEFDISQAAQDSRVSEIIELNRRIMHQQIIERDPRLFEEVSFDQFLVVAPGGRIENKAEAVAGVSGWDVESIDVRDEQVIFQGNTAVLVGRLRINGIMRPVGSLPPMKFMAVFVETDDGWKLLARSQTPCFEIAIERGFC